MTGRAAEIFEACVDLPEADRRAALVRACGEDEALRGRVEQLLRAHDSAGGFLAMPTRQGAAEPRRFVGDEGPGSTIGRYRLLDLIGEGGFGRVFMAEQREPVVRRVAVKVIKAGMDTAQVVARFEAERQALAMMDHPGIATVLDGGATQTGRPYFVMELVRGMPITAYCDAVNMPVAERLELFRQVCGAVQHAHQKGVIHRDLKPANILVAEQGDRAHPKIIDFGIAKAISGRLTDRTMFTEFRQFLGTPAYVSPEQTRSGGVDVDTRTDIYSLGVLLYELLTGTTPLDPASLQAADFGELQRLIREGDTPRPSTRVSALKDVSGVAAHRRTEPRRLGLLLRGDLDWIVLKAIEKDRNRRYETAAALAEDVRRFLAHEPVSATPPGAAYRLRKFVRRNRGPVLAALVIVLLLVVGVAGTGSGLLVAVRERARAEAQRQNAERVAGFMADLLQGVEAARARGRDTSVLREMLDGAAQRIENGELEDSPEAELRLRWTIGRAYTDIAEGGAAVRAETVLRPALGLAERTYGSRSSEAGWSRLTLARSLLTLGRLEDALDQYEEALDIHQRLYPGDHLTVVANLNGLSHCLEAIGRSEEGLSHALAAVAMGRRLFAGDDPQLASSLNNAGACLDARGRHEEALTHYRGALEMRQRLFTGDHPDLAGSLNNVAMCLDALGRWSEALPVHEAALRMQERLFEGDHPDLAWSVNNVAYCLNAMGRPADALPYFERALGMRRRLFNGDHPDTATNLNNVAACLDALGRSADAVPHYEAALAMFRRLSEGDQPNLANTMNNLAACLSKLGRPEESLRYAEAAVEMNTRMLPPDHVHILIAQLHRARALAQLNRFGEAESIYMDCTPKVLDHPDARERHKRRALTGAAELYEAWHAAEPGAGHDRKAAHWRGRLDAWEQATQPTASGEPSRGS